jgi:RNA polymerase sigma factor CnrH
MLMPHCVSNWQCYRRIEELPHYLRTALLLFTIEGRSQLECAELFGISSKAVESRVYRARKILENKLHQQDTK